MLVFPKGVRLAKSNEVPNNSDKSVVIENISAARIEQGYVSHSVSDSRFSCYAEANVNATQIWKVFRSLCEVLLPEEVAPIIGEIDEEPLHIGGYDSKEKLLDLFEPFKFYLANDCYIQLGFFAESENNLAEVFVTPTKHFQIWTDKPDALVKIMNEYDINESVNLQFIDEFPRTTIALKYDNGFDSHDDLINHLVELTGEPDS